MAIIMAVANQKGGVGKTTTCINMARTFSLQGKKCAIIDLDPQGNGTSQLLAQELYTHGQIDDDHPACCWGMFKSEMKPVPYVNKDGVHVICTSSRIERIEMDEILNFAGSIDTIEADYDFILIDCPPSSRVLQHAALSVADYVLVVTHAEPQSVKAVDTIMTTIRKSKRNNPNLKVAGIVMNVLENPPTNTQKKYVRELQETHGQLIFEHNLYKTVKVTEALAKGLSLHEYMPGHAEKFGFDAFTSEVLSRVEG